MKQLDLPFMKNFQIFYNPRNNDEWGIPGKPFKVIKDFDESGAWYWLKKFCKIGKSSLDDFYIQEIT